MRSTKPLADVLSVCLLVTACLASIIAPLEALDAFAASPQAAVPAGALVQRNWWALGAAASVIVLSIVVILMVVRRRAAGSRVVVPPAVLFDPFRSAGVDKYPITKARTRIGRLSTGNDFVIPQGTVSSQHAEIVYRDGAFYLRDLRSHNGTFVNGERVDGREVVLNHRDRVRFAAYEFEFSVLPHSAHEFMIVGANESGVHKEDAERPRYYDENVRFTVYRPTVVQPLRWYPLLVFAYLSERPPGASEDEPDPIEEVQSQAQRRLGGRIEDYESLSQDSGQPVPQEGELTLIPFVPGIEFNPPRRSFSWQESVHQEELRLRAAAGLDGRIARGRLSVFLGSILLAEVNLVIKVNSQDAPPLALSYERAGGSVYRKIFASYSHKDLPVVEEMERYAHGVGDEYLRDMVHLRSGEAWDDRLKDMINRAHLFQLFWSSNSIDSAFVEHEWRYALSLKRNAFVRPVYWEEPLPERLDKNLPPEELRRLHFSRIYPVSAVAMSDRKDETASKGPASRTAKETTTDESMQITSGVQPQRADVIGRYEILMALGKGSMGIVYEARDPDSGGLVAIKVISSEVGMTPERAQELRQRFRRQLSDTTRLRHPNICAIHQVSEESGQIVVVMEYIEGQSLERLLHHGYSFSAQEIASIGNQVALALDYAHAQGSVHRDIKPANIMLTSSGQVKVMDFGLARIAESTEGSTGLLIGTPSYMSPEQVAGGKVDGRSDQFSLAVTIYELLTGEKPFPGDSLTTMVYRILTEDPVSLCQLRPDLPEALDAVVGKAMAKDPADRYPRAADFGRALLAVTSGEVPA